MSSFDPNAEYECPEGCTWETYAEYVFDQFGYSPYDDETAKLVTETLRELYFGNQGDKHYFVRESEGYEWAFQNLLLGVLARHNITEYGTSPRGSWLTEKGRKLLAPLFEGVQP